MRGLKLNLIVFQVTVDEHSADVDGVEQKEIATDFVEACSLHPSDLTEAMKTFVDLLKSKYGGDWIIIINPSYFDPGDLTYAKLGVTCITCNIFPVPVYVYKAK